MVSRRWATLEGSLRRSHNGLPVILLPGVDLSRDIPLLIALEHGGSEDVLVACSGLVVVGVRGAVGAGVAVHGVTWRHVSLGGS